jgi:hypothetical protein
MFTLMRLFHLAEMDCRRDCRQVSGLFCQWIEGGVQSGVCCYVAKCITFDLIY